MDPLTQGLLGGVAAQTILRKHASKKTAFAGLLGAMAPDLDILIRSATDPLLALEFHRHFTHSLLFIPFGGTLAALILWKILFRGAPFKQIWLATTLGYATHGLLDAATGYGTQLYWPLSNFRVSWNVISILDPLFTLTLLTGFLISLFRPQGKSTTLALGLCLLYLGFGFYQNQQGLHFQKQLAQERGHRWERGVVRPTIGNLLLWRSVYESQDQYHVDALRMVPGQSNQFWEGGFVKKFDPLSLSLDANSRLAQDLKRYQWFSEDYLVLLSTKPYIVGDFRFSLLANGTRPLWGIEFNPTQPEQVLERRRFLENRDEAWEVLKKMLWGNYKTQLSDHQRNHQHPH